MVQTSMRRLLSTLAKRMKERRQVLGLSQEALADRSGLSSNFIARIEIGDKTPSLSTLVKLADALGMSVTDLLADEISTADDLADYVSHLLSNLDEDNRQFAMGQLRALVEHLQQQC
jgi:transcriptional regulator with XRE-family HTH domain